MCSQIFAFKTQGHNFRVLRETGSACAIAVMPIRSASTRHLLAQTNCQALRKNVCLFLGWGGGVCYPFIWTWKLPFLCGISDLVSFGLITFELSGWKLNIIFPFTLFFFLLFMHLCPWEYNSSGFVLSNLSNPFANSATVIIYSQKKQIKQ